MAKNKTPQIMWGIKDKQDGKIGRAYRTRLSARVWCWQKHESVVKIEVREV